MIVPRTAQTAEAVAAHYDTLDRFYRDIWGEHVHHGLWTTGHETPVEAVTALVELVASRLRLVPGLHLCDIGCGYGATARHLCLHYGATVAGVTLSRAQLRAARLMPGVTLAVQNWLANDFADASFDRAYAIESSEHMVDKERFFAEAARVLRPGGRLVVCAWLSADRPRAWQVRHLLEPICREGRLPGLGDEAEYRALANAAGLTVRGAEDLSSQVSRTWSICLRRGLARLLTDPGTRRFLRDDRESERVFALAVVRMILAFRSRALRYVLFTCEKGA